MASRKDVGAAKTAGGWPLYVVPSSCDAAVHRVITGVGGGAGGHPLLSFRL